MKSPAQNEATMTDTIFSGDQTTFAQEEPLFERRQLPPAQLTPEDEKRLTHQAHRRRLLIGLGSGFVIFSVSLAMLLVSLPKYKQNTIPTPTPTASTPVTPLNAYHQRALDLRSDLEAADPTHEFLPPPPVDLQLRLEDTTTRRGF